MFTILFITIIINDRLHLSGRCYQRQPSKGRKLQGQNMGRKAMFAVVLTCFMPYAVAVLHPNMMEVLRKLHKV